MNAIHSERHGGRSLTVARYYFSFFSSPDRFCSSSHS